MLIEVLSELDACREDEHLELVEDTPGGFTHNGILVTCANFDHSIPQTRGEWWVLGGAANSSLAEDSPIGLPIGKVLNQDFVDIDIDLAVSVLVNQVSPSKPFNNHS